MVTLFYMDGSEHTSPQSETHCCMEDVSDEPCSKCGGYLHYQAVYGGFYYECEDCHEIYC